MAKEPVAFPSRPEQHDPVPPRTPAIFVVGDRQYQIRINTLRELRVPSRPADIIPINRKPAALKTKIL